MLVISQDEKDSKMDTYLEKLYRMLFEAENNRSDPTAPIDASDPCNERIQAIEERELEARITMINNLIVSYMRWEYDKK